MGVDGETEMGAELRPDRYYLLSDSGSFFFDLAGDNDGFESPEAAAEWARTQTVWPDLAGDLDEGAAAVVLGSEWNANQAAQEAAEAAGFPEGWLDRLPRVRNFARRSRTPNPRHPHTRSGHPKLVTAAVGQRCGNVPRALLLLPC